MMMQRSMEVVVKMSESQWCRLAVAEAAFGSKLQCTQQTTLLQSEITSPSMVKTDYCNLTFLLRG